jgi:hypothetical protein
MVRRTRPILASSHVSSSSPKANYRIDASGTSVGLVRIRTRIVSCTKPPSVPPPAACEIGGQTVSSGPRLLPARGWCRLFGARDPSARRGLCAASGLHPWACDGAPGQCRMLRNPLKGLRPADCTLGAVTSATASYGALLLTLGTLARRSRGLGPREAKPQRARSAHRTPVSGPPIRVYSRICLQSE